MATFKNIRIKMKNGKSRLQRVKVLASGKFKFVKNLTRKQSSPGKKGKTSTKKKSTTHKKGSGKVGKTKTLTLGVVSLGLVGTLVAHHGTAGQPLFEAQAGNWGRAATALITNAKEKGLMIGLGAIGLALARKAFGNPTVIKLGNIRIAAL